MTSNAIIPMLSFNTSTPAIYVLHLCRKRCGILLADLRHCPQEGLLSLVGKRVTQRFSRTNLWKAFDISLPLILS